MRRERLFENIKGAFLHMGLFGGASSLNGRASKNRQASTDACLFLSVYAVYSCTPGIFGSLSKPTCKSSSVGI